jgi:hypothetical protein
METLTPFDPKDPELWDLAHRRAGFKWHLIVYLFINALLILISLIKGNRPNYWLLLWWGIGLGFHYFSVYYRKLDLTQQEYEKLLRDKENGKPL